MNLKELKITNFKGIQSLTVPIDDEGVSIYGDNGTGKTTIADAFYWLMFGKDSLNQANFEVKPVDSNGAQVEVEAVVENGSGKQTLKKVLAERWTKRRGVANKELTGHDINHFIDGVPINKKKDFDAAIADICDENLFKLLTNPRYFNEQLHWQGRRRILLEVCGDVSDADVIASKKELADLPAILGKHSIDDHRKILNSRRPEINRELESIPVRIDEISKGKAAGRDPLTIKSAITMQRSLRKDKESELNLITNGGGVAAKSKELAEVEAELLKMENKAQAERQKAADSLEKERMKLVRCRTNAQIEATKSEEECERISRKKSDVESQISGVNETLGKLRSEWSKINAESFTHEATGTCPTCGQPIPQDKAEAAKEKALAKFNAEKAAKLKMNQDEGKQKAGRLTELKAVMADIESQIADADSDLERKNCDLESAIENLMDLDSQQSVVDAEFVEDTKRTKLIEKSATIKAEIEQLKAGAETDVQPLHDEINKIDEGIEALQTELAAVEGNAKGEARVEELKDQEKALAAEFEKLERELHLLDEFTRAKVSMLDERINGKFVVAQWRMFREQINGGLEQCCDCMIDGVPYHSANNAARINAGIDICNVLAAHHGVTLPMFVDNAESVTSLLPSNGQQISLVVSEKDKELRIE